MTLDEALEAAQQAANEDLRGQYPMAAQVLAAEVIRLRASPLQRRVSQHPQRWRNLKEVKVQNQPTFAAMNASAEMPRYQCHKKVWALKIASIEHRPNPDTTGRSASASYGATITPEDDGYAAFDVPAEYVTKHRPEPGGYFVVYEGGYKSYSPAQAFEEGYTRL